MAATITHFVLADKVFEKFFAHLKKDEFFIGNIFPDIRYTGVIEREKTHFFDGSLKEINQNDSFLAGTQFHRLTDKIEVEFARKSGIYTILPDSIYSVTAMKLFCDQIFYSKVKNWPEYASYLKKILPSELNYNLSESQIKKWHQMVITYTRSMPNDQTRAELIGQTIMPDEAISEINQLISDYSRNEKLKNLARKLYNSFEAMLKNYD